MGNVRSKGAWASRLLVAAIGAVAVFPAASSAVSLPDGRAYEIVNPADKFGYQAGGNQGPANELAVGAQGERVTYSGIYPLPGSASGSNAAFFAERASDGWKNSSLNPVPGVNQIGIGFSGADATLRGSTSDQRAGVYYDNTTAPNGSLWLVRDNGVRKRIADASVTAFFQLWGNAPGQPWFEGISADASHVVFASTDALVPGLVSTGNEILYDWADDGANGGAGTIRVVNRTNSPTLTLIDSADATLGGSARHTMSGDASVGLRNAISADGSRIFFQTPAPTQVALVPQGGGPVYARQDGAETVNVSAPHQGYTPTTAPTLYQYLDASNSTREPALDGRYVFFWANGDLVAGAPTAGGIYRYDMDREELEFIGVASPSSSGPPTALASDDGSRLYYTDGPDIRVWDGGSTRTVAERLSPSGTRATGLANLISVGFGLHADGCPSAGITPSGSYLVFTAEDETPFFQVYRYDLASGELAKLTAPDGVSAGDAGFADAGSCATTTYPRNIDTRVVSDDGQFVFFTTAAGLVPEDSNRQHDVYEWHAGTISLISQGTSSRPAVLHGMDATGANVFFSTTDALVPQDPDDLYDMYTARIGGGFPLPRVPVPCSGDACQGGLPPAPQRPVAGSETFEGPGDVSDDSVPTEVSVGKLSQRQLRAWARTGATRVRVKVTVPGRVDVQALARMGGVTAVVARAGRVAKHPSTVQVRLKLAKPALKSLRRRGQIRLTLVTRFSKSTAAVSTPVVLRAPARKGRR